MKKEMKLMRMCEEWTAMILSSQPEQHEWVDVGMSTLDGGVRVRAVAREGEPHFMIITLQIAGGRIRTNAVCCPHVEALVEKILMGESPEEKKRPSKVGIRSRAGR